MQFVKSPPLDPLALFELEELKEEEITPPSSPGPTTTTTTCNCACSKELKKIREQLANMAQVQTKIYLELKNMKKTSSVSRPDKSEVATVELRGNFPLKTIEEVQKMEVALMDKEVFQEIFQFFMTIDGDLNLKFKYMFRDEVFIKCNLSGLAQQPALDANINLLHILRATTSLDEEGFRKRMRLLISNSKNRIKCHKHRQKKKGIIKRGPSTDIRKVKKS